MADSTSFYYQRFFFTESWFNSYLSLTKKFIKPCSYIFNGIYQGHKRIVMERSHYRTFIYLNMNGLCYKYNVYNKADLHTDQETYKVNKSHLLEYDLYGLKIQNIYFITNICSAFPNVQLKVAFKNNLKN